MDCCTRLECNSSRLYYIYQKSLTSNIPSIFKRHPALKVTRILVPKQVESTKRSTKNYKSSNRINVNELVNAELYTRVSHESGDSKKYLMQNYTPQQMRGILIQNSKNYYAGNACLNPKKINRGIVN